VLAWFCLDKFSFINLQGLPQESNHYQNLITIHAGIGAIIFALVIFVAESLRDDEVKDRARVLLKESYLFPLAVAEILVFFIFIWGDVNFWRILPVIAIGLFTIWSLSKIVLVLLSKYRFAQKRAEMLQERLRQSIDLAIDERIGNNILLSKLDGKDIKLEYHPFSIDNETEYHCFHAEKFGTISDIDLQALKKLADTVDEEGQKSGFSFGGGEKPQVSVGEEGAVEETESKLLPKNNQRYLMKKYHDVVDEEHRVLICLDKKLFKDASKLEEISALVSSVFIIKPADNFAEEFGKFLKNQFLTTNQIRNIFGEIKSIQLKAKSEEDFQKEIGNFIMIKAKMAYVEGRNRSVGLTEFRKIFDLAHKEVKDKQSFENFVSFITAILAYHRAAGGK
jgi:CRISPR type III-A-associated protein Csm2